MVRSIQFRSRFVGYRNAVVALLAIGLTGGCGQDPVGPVQAGSYALRGSLQSDLPLNLRATEHGETALTAGILELGSAPAGSRLIPGELTLSLYNGPVGGPYTGTDAVRIPFTAEQQGRRLVLTYPSSDGSGPVSPDTLQIRAGGSLVGRVNVPNSDAGRLTLVFRWAILF